MFASAADWIADVWRRKAVRVLVLFFLGSSGSAIFGLLQKIPDWYIAGAGSRYVSLIADGLYLALIALGLAVVVSQQRSSEAEVSSLRDFVEPARRLYGCFDQETRYELRELRLHYAILPDYSLRFEQHMIIAAKETPVVAIGVRRGSQNVMVNRISDIKFSVMPGPNQGRVHYIPAEDQPAQKRFLVFFDPLLRPGDTKEISFQHTWPESAKKLKRPNVMDTNEFMIPTQAIAHVPVVHVKVTLPAIGARFRVESSVSGSQTELPDSEGSLEWSEKMVNLPPGTNLAVYLRRLPASK